MNKRFLLPVVAFLSFVSNGSALSFDLSKQKAEQLLARVALSQQCTVDPKSVLSAALRDLVEFGYRAEQAKPSTDLDSLAGKTSAQKLLEQAETNSRTKLINLERDILFMRKNAVDFSNIAIKSYEKNDQFIQNNMPHDITSQAFHLSFGADEFNSIANRKTEEELDPQCAAHDNLLVCIKEVLNGTPSSERPDSKNVMAADQEKERAYEKLSSEPTIALSVVHYAKDIVANKWTKRAAGIIGTCAIGKLLYNRYNRSKKSNEKEDDHE